MRQVGGYRIIDRLEPIQCPVEKRRRDIYLAECAGQRFMLTVFQPGKPIYICEKARRNARADAGLHNEQLRKFYPYTDELHVKHPNIIQTYPCEWEGDTLFAVVEYVEGRCLDDCILASGPPSVSDVVTIAIAASEVAEHEPDRGFRSLEIQQILISYEGIVKLPPCSSMLTRFRREEYRPSRLPVKRSKHAVSISRNYFPAEVPVRPGRVSVLHELTGKAARLARLHCLGQLVFELLTQELASLDPAYWSSVIRKRCPKAPDQLIQIVERLLAPNPEGRFQTFSQLSDALKGLRLRKADVSCRPRR